MQKAIAIHFQEYSEEGTWALRQETHSEQRDRSEKNASLATKKEGDKFMALKLIQQEMEALQGLK